jgi:hypothetical protein
MRPSPLTILMVLFLCQYALCAPPTTQSNLITKEYDVTDLLRGARLDSQPDPTKIPRHATDKIGGEHPTRAETVINLLNVVKETVDPDSCKDNGGSIGEIRESSGKLIVTQSAEAHRSIRSLFAQFRERPTTAQSNAADNTPANESVTRVYDIRDIPVGACVKLAPDEFTSRDQAIRALEEKIMQEIAPRTWSAHGGTTGYIRETGGQLIVTQENRHHKAIKALLDDCKSWSPDL